MKNEFLPFNKVYDLLKLDNTNKIRFKGFNIFWSCEEKYPSCSSLGLRGYSNSYLDNDKLYTYRTNKGIKIK